MSNISPGPHRVSSILEIADLDFEKEVESDYRRVEIGGLSISDLDQIIVVPETAESIVITVDGNEHTTLTVSA